MKYSLVLGGGGAKGSYEFGVFKALMDMNIEIDSVYGTSIGALNGAMIVQGSIDKAEKLWSEITAKDIMDIDDNISDLLEKGGISSTLEFMIHVINSKRVDITPFKKLLNEVIDENAIRESKIDFGIVTFLLEDFKPVKIKKSEIPEGKLIDYLVASSALPAFKSHTIDDKTFLDGAFCDNVPISLAINDNCKNIIVIDLAAPGIIDKVNTNGFNIVKIENPQNVKGTTLSFNRENIIFNMNLGYLDGKKAFDHLIGYDYYFEKNGSIHDFLEKNISSLKLNDIKKIYKDFGIEINPKDVVTSKLVLDSISDTLKKHAKGDINKKSIFISSLEILGEFLDIDKFKVYKIEDFFCEIKDKINKEFSNINEKEYLDYIKNSVSLTGEKEKISFFDSNLKKNQLLMYLKAHISNDTSNRFKRFISKFYPRLSVAVGVLLFLNRKRYILFDTGGIYGKGKIR